MTPAVECDSIYDEKTWLTFLGGGGVFICNLVLCFKMILSNRYNHGNDGQ